jgi:Protein kinase domain
MDNDPFTTQRDASSAVAGELQAAGFDDAEEIGRGGFGIVYRCHQVALDRTVAVKVLITEPDENRERFLREQRAMGRLTGHPNIVGVLRSANPGRLSVPGDGISLPRLAGGSDLRIGAVAGALETAHNLGILCSPNTAARR